MYCSESGKFLYQFYKERESAFIQHLESLKIHLDEEEIHNLRRAGKRIKALSQLFERIDSSYNYAKRFAPIKEVFNNAGLLREIQVNLRTLGTYKPLPKLVKHYEEFVFNKRQVYRDQLEKALSEYDQHNQDKTVKKTKKLCKQIEHDTIQKSSLKYIRENLDKIRLFIADGNTEDNVHSVRIHLKRISPVINMLNLIKVPEFEKDFGVIKTAEDKIGYWHDRVVLLETLKQMKKIFPIREEIRYDFEFILDLLQGESNVFIKNIDKLIQPCIKELNEVIAIPVSSKNP